jgi:hypothetical protein
LLGQVKTLLVSAKNLYSRDLGRVAQSDEGGEGLKISLLTSFHYFFSYYFCAVICLACLDFVDLRADD